MIVTLFLGGGGQPNSSTQLIEMKYNLFRATDQETDENINVLSVFNHNYKP